MASICFCGCGREIKGLRAKANNAAAGEISDDLAVLRGALDKGEAGEQTDRVTALAAEGANHLASLARFLHGEIERGDLDKGAIKAWLAESRRACKSLVRGASGPAWEPDHPRTDELAQSGTRAKGVITDVSRDGLGNERVASLRMTASIAAPDGSRFDVSRTLSISVVKAPRVGDRIEVSYDPGDPNRFVYRPLIELPDAD
jgi:hypothetical protein